MRSSRPRLIVCERRGVWAAAARRQLDAKTPISQVRSLVECFQELTQSPHSIVALELVSENVSGVIRLIAALEHELPAARAMVFSNRRMACYEPFVREAGAIYFTSSPCELIGLTGTVERHLSLAPSPRLHWADQIWKALPWGDAG